MNNNTDKPIKFSWAGGSNEIGANEVYNYHAMKEVLKRVFFWNDQTLNKFKDVEVDKTFFNSLNVRKTLMALGSQIGREVHGDIWVLNHIENIINRIDNNEEIEDIVSVIGYAGHGKDFQISLLHGNFSATGDIRFPNELKLVLIVNEFRNDPKRLREELFKLAQGFTFDPELLEAKMYTHLMGSGNEEGVDFILDKAEQLSASTYEDLFDIYTTLNYEKIPNLHEVLNKLRLNFLKDYRQLSIEAKENISFIQFIKTLAFEKNNRDAALYIDVLQEGSKQIAKTTGADEERTLEMLESDVDLDHFYFNIDQNGKIEVLKRDFYVKNGEEWIKEDLEKEEDIISKMDNAEEKNKLEFLKTQDAFFDNFERKREFFNPEGTPDYANGIVNSSITMDPKDYSKLSENNIFVIFKVFEIPEEIAENSSTLVEFEEALISHHLENVYKPFFDIQKDYFNECINLLNDLSSIDSGTKKTEYVKESIKNKLHDFVSGMLNGDTIANAVSNEIDLMASKFSEIDPGDKSIMHSEIKSFTEQLQKVYDTSSDYEKEMRNAFSNHKEIFKDEFANVSERKKMQVMSKILNNYGLTRSNVKHDSEQLISIILDNGGELIYITPYANQNDILNQRIAQNKKNKKNKAQSEDSGKQPK